MKIYIDPSVINQVDIKKVLEPYYSKIDFVSTLDHPGIEVAMVLSSSFISEENLAKLPNLKWIQLLSAGYDGTNFDLLKNHNILYTNAKDVFHVSIAEDVIAKILLLNRNYTTYINNMKQGVWEKKKNEIELSGSTIGILGTGSIGSAIAKRLKAFDTHLIGYRKTQKATPFFDEIVTGDKGLDTLLIKSDYVIVALPLNNQTHHLLTKEKLALMKASALFINIGRGNVVDQDALTTLLATSAIRGAALDVTTPEPLPKEHPLWQLPNVIITPHNATSSNNMFPRLAKLIDDNLSHYLKKEPLKFRVEE